VAQGFSEIILKANPNYWAMNASNIPAVAQPAHIPVIVIYYGLSHTDRVEDFDQNIAQISYVSVPFIGQMYSGYKYKGVPLTAIFINKGSVPETLYLSMNTQKWPTNISMFRKAVVHAINYTALLDIFKYNGSSLATYFVGPISPQYPVYNEVVTFDKLSPYNYNLSLALHYMNEAGYVGDFYVVLPNGTILGNPNGIRLPTIPIYAIAPINSLEQLELEIIQFDLEQIGVSTSVILVTPSQVDTWVTPNATPNFVMLGWLPDWPDPIYQQLMPLTDVQFGGISGNLAWVDIPQLQQIYQTLPFMTSGSTQTILLAYVYFLIYNYTPYVWLPVPDTYFFVQPYVHGFTYNPFAGYWYNMIYYENYTYTYTTTEYITTTTVTQS
ncbi:MAG: ABC transporter substrate-binding protein, partial [Sulfolobaceae archaeon]|nr:ABC transporter substrate-binding protein [Sulfolobaceae archaeon]